MSLSLSSPNSAAISFCCLVNWSSIYQVLQKFSIKYLTLSQNDLTLSLNSSCEAYKSVFVIICSSVKTLWRIIPKNNHQNRLLDKYQELDTYWLKNNDKYEGHYKHHPHWFQSQVFIIDHYLVHTLNICSVKFQGGSCNVTNLFKYWKNEYVSITCEVAQISLTLERTLPG